MLTLPHTVSFSSTEHCPFQTDFPIGKCFPVWFCLRSFPCQELTSWGRLLSTTALNPGVESSRSLTQLLASWVESLFPVGQSHRGSFQTTRSIRSQPCQSAQITIKCKDKYRKPSQSLCSSTDYKSAPGTLYNRVQNQRRGSADVLKTLKKIFWPCHTSCGILVPWSGIKPLSPAVEAWSLNHWTTREVPADF